MHVSPSITQSATDLDANSSLSDWFAWYKSQEEDVGQGGEQSEWIVLMVGLLMRWAARRGWTEAFVGSDCFFAWEADDPRKVVAPDVFLVDSAPNPLPTCFQTWRPGHHAPRIAFEFVSENWRKDYLEAPQTYDDLGVDELVIFDPRPSLRATVHTAEAQVRLARQPLQHFTRNEHGRLVRTYMGLGPVRSPALDAYLTLVNTERGIRLRLATDAEGLHLLPTAEEASEALHARIEAETERVEALHARVEAETERAEQARARAEAEAERAEQERARAEAEAERAEQERARAEAEAERADALARELAELRARLGLPT